MQNRSDAAGAKHGLQQRVLREGVILDTGKLRGLG